MSLSANDDRAGVTWQRGIWDRYPEIYQREVDMRFVPVVQQVIRRAALAPAQQQEAQAAVLAALWPHGDSPRHFRNVTLFMLGQRPCSECSGSP